METWKTCREQREYSCHRENHHYKIIFLVSLHHLRKGLNVTFSVKAPQEKLCTACYRRVNKEQDKVFMIPDSNTVAHPRAMMIHSQNAFLAYWAVMSTRRPYLLAFFAIWIFLKFSWVELCLISTSVWFNLVLRYLHCGDRIRILWEEGFLSKYQHWRFIVIWFGLFYVGINWRGDWVFFV